MKLSYVRNSFDTFSGKVSDLSRQFAFAGIAVIWIFKVDNKTKYNLPIELYRPLYLFCFGLLTDLFQYVYGTVAWGIVLRVCKKYKENEEISIKRAINIPTWILFVFKVLFLLLAYYYVLNFMIVKFDLAPPATP